MTFFNHPIISAIIQDPCTDEDSLYKQSGIINKKEFNQELKLLIEEGHLSVDWAYNLRANYLSTYYKGICIDTIDVPYKSSKELAELLEWDTSIIVDDEESFDFNLFIAEIAIVAKYKAKIEELCSVQLDLEKYNYYIHARWMDLSNKDEENHLKNINIIHLDDDPVFSNGIKNVLLDKYFPESNWFHFTDTDEALQFVLEKLVENKSVPLIITDLTPKGIQGYGFAENVRRMEFETLSVQSPIVVMSFLETENPLVSPGLQDKTFTGYFSKGEDVGFFGASLKRLLQPNKLGVPGYLNNATWI